MLLAIPFLLAAQGLREFPPLPPNERFREEFERHYRRATSVRVGMSRIEFERIYESDGGLQRVPANRFVYRNLPYFMVEVEFKFAKPARKDRDGRTVQATGPRDRVSKVGPIVLSRKHGD